jgi:hypothetical protein
MGDDPCGLQEGACVAEDTAFTGCLPTDEQCHTEGIGGGAPGQCKAFARCPDGIKVEHSCYSPDPADSDTPWSCDCQVNDVYVGSCQTPPMDECLVEEGCCLALR